MKGVLDKLNENGLEHYNEAMSIDNNMFYTIIIGYSLVVIIYSLAELLGETMEKNEKISTIISISGMMLLFFIIHYITVYFSPYLMFLSEDNGSYTLVEELYICVKYIVYFLLLVISNSSKNPDKTFKHYSHNDYNYRGLFGVYISSYNYLNKLGKYNGYISNLKESYNKQIKL